MEWTSSETLGYILGFLLLVWARKRRKGTETYERPVPGAEGYDVLLERHETHERLAAEYRNENMWLIPLLFISGIGAIAFAHSLPSPLWADIIGVVALILCYGLWISRHWAAQANNPQVIWGTMLLSLFFFSTGITLMLI